MAILGGQIKFTENDSLGNPLVGGRLYAYAAGTSNKKDTYTDSTATVKNTNPIILNARGECDLWIDGIYDFVLKDKDGNTIWTVPSVSINGSSDEAIFYDSNGYPVLNINTVGASAVNYLNITNTATGNSPTLTVNGSDTNIDLAFISNGTADFNVTTKATVQNLYVSGDYYDADDRKVVALGGSGGPLTLTSGSGTAKISKTGTLTFSSNAAFTNTASSDIGISGTLTMKYAPTVPYTATVGSSLQLYDTTTSGYILTLKAPDSLSGDSTITLPDESPTNTYFVATDGSENWYYDDIDNLLSLSLATTTVKGGAQWDTVLQASDVSDEFTLGRWATIVTGASPNYDPSIAASYGVSNITDQGGATFHFKLEAGEYANFFLVSIWDSAGDFIADSVLIDDDERYIRAATETAAGEGAELHFLCF